MIQDLIHNKIVQKRCEVDEWFRDQGEGLAFPFSASFDIRDSGYKVSPVDANIFPAGLNNICQVDKENAVEIAKDYLERHYKQELSSLLILAEGHTKNAYYWENIYSLYDLLKSTGREIRISLPKNIPDAVVVQSSSGRELIIHPHEIRPDGVFVDGLKADLIICNNDFSEKVDVWTTDVQTPINPPIELGWYQRKKNHFFNEYNQISKQFCEILGLDPWILNIRTATFEGFDVTSDDSLERLAQQVDQEIDAQRAHYKEYKIEGEPFVFVKNISGTYGLAVIQAQSGDQIRSWNYKSRKKMKATKGGGAVENLIIQEGIPSAMIEDEETREPVIYMIGRRLSGGFLRAHAKKGPNENLNSPGAVYKRLCVSDLNINIEGCPMENVYGWVAKIGALALAHEAKSNGIKFKAYNY